MFVNISVCEYIREVIGKMHISIGCAYKNESENASEQREAKEWLVFLGVGAGRLLRLVSMCVCLCVSLKRQSGRCIFRELDCLVCVERASAFDGTCRWNLVSRTDE